MSDDTYRPVTDYPVTEYCCGARAGDRVRVRRDIVVRDHSGNPTSKIHRAGEIWSVLPGAAEEPVVVWLQQADGETHTWSDDEDFRATFEISPRQPI